MCWFSGATIARCHPLLCPQQSPEIQSMLAATSILSQVRPVPQASLWEAGLLDPQFIHLSLFIPPTFLPVGAFWLCSAGLSHHCRLSSTAADYSWPRLLSAPLQASKIYHFHQDSNSAGTETSGSSSLPKPTFWMHGPLFPTPPPEAASWWLSQPCWMVNLGERHLWVKWNCSPYPFQCSCSHLCVHLGKCNFFFFSYTTATTQDTSLDCDLYHSSQQPRSLLNEARDRTRNLMVPSPFLSPVPQQEPQGNATLKLVSGSCKCILVHKLVSVGLRACTSYSTIWLTPPTPPHSSSQQGNTKRL